MPRMKKADKQLLEVFKPSVSARQEYKRGMVVKYQTDWEDTSREVLITNDSRPGYYLIQSIEEEIEREFIREILYEVTPEEFYARVQTHILEKVPVEFRGALAWIAYDRGHGSGYDEVLSLLLELVDALAKPIAEYTKRLALDLRT